MQEAEHSPINSFCIVSNPKPGPFNVTSETQESETNRLDLSEL